MSPTPYTDLYERPGGTARATRRQAPPERPPGGPARGRASALASSLRSRRADAGTVRRLVRQTRPRRAHLGALVLLSLVAAPIGLLMPVPLKIAVDSVIGSHPLPGPLDALLPSDATWLVLVAIGALFVLVALLRQAQAALSLVLGAYVGEKALIRFRTELFGHVQRLSLSYHDTRGTSESIYRIQYDASCVRDVVVAFFPLFTSAATFAAMLYVTATIDLMLAVVAMIVAPILVAMARTYSRRLRGHWHVAQRLESRGMSVVQEALGALRVVNAFGQEDRERSRFAERAGEGLGARVRLATLEGTFSLLVTVTTAVGTAVVLAVGVAHVRSGAITLGELLLVMTYLSLLYQPLETMGRKLADLQSALASAERALTLLDHQPEVVERPGARPIHRAAGAIAFELVSFSYDGRSRAIDGISLEVEPGSRVGIAGTTGAGKTTLISLLMRFYDPSEGRVLLDGVDLRDYRLRDLRDQFAMVLQEPVLFSTSIMENIAYARPEASSEEIVAAARAADADDFIRALPEGYATEVGERGMRLSGGERQRVSLARAFLKDAPILVLDEPTSAVDLQTEEAIIDALGRLMEGRTTFMIAHRLSTLEGCDLRLRIEHGRLAEVTRPELKLAG